jgi:uncharacterized membrane protein
MKKFRVLDYALALCACAAAVLDCIRAFNPTLMISVTKLIPAYWVGIIFATLAIVLSLILYGIAHHQSKGGYTSSRTMVAVLISLLSMVLVVISIFISSYHPHGLVNTQLQKAPLQSKDRAQQVVSAALGECKSGWVDVGDTDVEGLSFGIACSSLKTAYVEFKSPEAAQEFHNSMKNEGTSFMRNYDSATWQPFPTRYDGLSGQMWAAITPQELSKALSSIIGGKSERLR